MFKRPFLIFITVVGVLVGGALIFIQSPPFARIVKGLIARNLPKDLGVEGDFSEFAIKLFPPGVSIRSPKAVVRQSKLIDLPVGSAVSAERIDLIFLPFQIFSGNIRVNQVVIVNGELDLHFDKEYLEKRDSSRVQVPSPKNKSLKFSIHWDELLRVRAESVILENTVARVSLAEPPIKTELKASYLKLGQWSGKGGLGYELEMELREIQGSFPKKWQIPDRLEEISARVQVNALGAFLKEFKAKHGGLSLEANGQIKGNLLYPKGLETQGHVELSAELVEFLQWIDRYGSGEKISPLKPKVGKSEIRKGKIFVKADVKGDLENPMETLEAKGTAQASDFNWGGWEASKIEVDGKWVASATGGKIEVQKTIVRSQERERVLPHGTSSGGKVEIGAISWVVGSMAPIKVPLKLERADLQWLLGSEAGSVYNLAAKISGSVNAEVTQTKPGFKGVSIKAGIDLDAESFQLDNQKFGVLRPLRKTLVVPKVTLKGPLVLDPKGFSFEKLQVELGKTKFLGVGNVTANTGLDLRFTGPVELSEVGSISQKQIRGSGTLETWVHGPADKVELVFSADLTDAQYLNLNFGKFRGNVIYDDFKSELRFEESVIRPGRSLMKGGGVIDLVATDRIDLNVDILEGNTQDLFLLFEKLTQGLTWLPRSLTGNVQGKVQVSGFTDIDRLRVVADLNGTQWSYLGETFKSVFLRGGYDSGKYFIESLQAKKRFGGLSGKVLFEEKDDKLSWDLSTQALQVGDFDRIASLDIPIKGRVEIKSSGKGSMGSKSGLQSETKFKLSEAKVRGSDWPDSEMTLKSNGTEIGLIGDTQGGQAKAEINYNFRDGTESSLALKLNGFDFSPVLLLLNPTLMQDRNLLGKVTGGIGLKFNSGQIEYGTGSIELSEYLIAKSGTQFELKNPFKVGVEKGTFKFPQVVFKGPQGEVQIDLDSKSGALEGSMKGDLDLGIVQFFTSALSSTQGFAQLDFTIDGKLKEPKVYGKATIEDASIQLRALESPFENLSGVLTLRQNVVSVQNLEANLSSGRASMSGSVTLFASQAPELNLETSLRDSRLKVYPFQFVKARGKLKASGRELPYLVTGDLFVDSALAKEKILAGGRSSRGTKAARFTPVSLNNRETDLPLFKLDIRVRAERGVMVQNELFDAEMKGDVRIVNTIDTPRIMGKAELIQGKMNFKDRIFQIQSASMDFDNPSSINPRLGMVASTEINQTRIQFFATGRLEDYKIELSSNPALPQNEILSLLALGVTSDDVNRLRRSDQGVSQSGNAASLVLNSLDFNRDIKKKTGFQLQIDDAVNNVVGNSIFQSGPTQAAVNSSPKIVIRRKLTNRLDVSMGATVGVGTASQREFNAEYQVSKGASVMGVWNSIEGVDVANSLRSSFGLDLRLQKRFK